MFLYNLANFIDLFQEIEDSGPIPPEDIQEAFAWHEQRLSKRGLEPEGLKQGVTIQHKFDDGEVLTATKAAQGLTKVFLS